MDNTIFSTLIPAATPTLRASIANTLEKFGPGILEFTASKGITVHPLGSGETYVKASPALARLGIDVDTWPAPPAGLFVVEERTVYIRSRSEMTIAHEFGHALDCALGDGIYRSGVHPVIRRCFAEATAFITPYAATGVDEYFAECVRAFVECNDASSHWPQATGERLRRLDPAMYEVVENIFGGFD